MKLREEIQEQYTWDLTPIYATDEAFEQDFQAVHPLLEKVDSYSGRL